MGEYEGYAGGFFCSATVEIQPMSSKCRRYSVSIAIVLLRKDMAHSECSREV
jgi:hypothetical protein